MHQILVANLSLRGIRSLGELGGWLAIPIIQLPYLAQHFERLVFDFSK